MSASVSFKDIEAMLKDCASGFGLRTATHSRVITYNSRVYRSFPKHAQIELGYVRSLVRSLGIDKECANRHFPGLLKDKSKTSGA